MTDQYRWTSHKPLGRDDPVEQGDVFEPTDAELEAFGDLMAPVEDGEAVPDPTDLTVDELEEVAAKLDQNDLLILRELEKEGKDRSTALEVIDAALEEA